MSWDSYGQAGQPDTRTSLWMGELEPWMDENFLRNTWYSLGENVQIKMIRDKFTGGLANYCFIEFTNNPSALNALAKYQNQVIPGANKIFRLNWASGGGGTGAGGAMERPGMMDQGPEYSIFVGDLAPEVTDYMLMNLFASHYQSVKSAKVVTDPLTNASRGYGFVRFRDENEQMRALNEMQGVFCGSRAMRISMATPKNKDLARVGTGMTTGTSFGSSTGSYTPQPMPAQPLPQSTSSSIYNPFTDPNNTTVFVGGLSATVSEEELRQFFGPYGSITYTKIPPGKGCGFVQFSDRQAAEQAISTMNGYNLGGSRIRLSWGRAHNAPNLGPVSPMPMMPGPIPVGPAYPAAAAPMYPYAYPQPVGGVGMDFVPMFPLVAVPLPPEDPTQPLDVRRANEQFVNEKEGILDRTAVVNGWSAIRTRD
ncbi:RNA-binding domain-containing protein [Gonapodya prolifera JEL478]|uniref:RNA-binding domain-containing protein n=1 Tax=Gonapodya prolifera (strain JEL478) TaxID=1344416 RepID=A0A139A8R3_GONPJ|nr:RNA-binding domain-containing protein [Gonapodya prolifera JEL478]|eukprot:KXS13182.1 RNA-binding domain-containing protein [Gonapodya prolifera JEL478]